MMAGHVPVVLMYCDGRTCSSAYVQVSYAYQSLARHSYGLILSFGRHTVIERPELWLVERLQTWCDILIGEIHQP
jgi:hypothetical protein